MLNTMTDKMDRFYFVADESIKSQKGFRVAAEGKRAGNKRRLPTLLERLAEEAEVQKFVPRIKSNRGKRKRIAMAKGRARMADYQKRLEDYRALPTSNPLASKLPHPKWPEERVQAI